MRRCLMLDLKEDPALIAEYEAHHRSVWPAVLVHLREQGITRMEIFRLETRLCMLMETDDSRFDVHRAAQAALADPAVQAWEHLMWRFQAPTPWSKDGEKWVEAEKIFDLSSQTS